MSPVEPDGSPEPPEVEAPVGPADGAWLSRALARCGVDHARAEAVVTASRIGVGIGTSEREDRVGRTRLGGLPDLAVGDAWPVWGGVSMRFLAQIDLAELPDVPDRELLPASGLLSLFFDGDDDRAGFLGDDSALDGRGAVCVRHVAARTPLTAPTWPSDLSEWARHPGRVADLRPVLTLPQADYIVGDELALTTAEQQAMVAIGEAAITDSHSGHWLLGNPLEVQGNVFYDMQQGWDAGGATVDASWRLLAQIGSDGPMDLDWATRGRCTWGCWTRTFARTAGIGRALPGSATDAAWETSLDQPQPIASSFGLSRSLT